MTESKLPLKQIAIVAADYFVPPPGGSGAKIFEPVTPAVRNRVASQVQSVTERFRSAFRATPRTAAVARVTLKSEALAKTHRPLQLFANADCPVIGVGGFGELFISVREQGLAQLENAVRTQTTRTALSNISTIDSIEPFSFANAQLEALEAEARAHPLLTVKLKLFSHEEPGANESLKQQLKALLAELKVDFSELRYASTLSVFRLVGMKAKDVRPLANFVGTQSLGHFPTFRVVRPAVSVVGTFDAASLPGPDPRVDYPTVGLIDTGIDPSNQVLSPWVEARDLYVLPPDRDYHHGTFVGGLLVNARRLNQNDQSFPSCSCRVVDVVAVPATGEISEDDLIAIIGEVVPKHPHVNVWNLSMAGSEPCSDHAFSDFAVALDEIQSSHGVTFVIAAGNYSNPPFREWPPSGNLGDDDRICAPADSVRALTVGSIAHRESASSRVRMREPSPFSRRGPGPVYIPKPEVAHFGGNCDSNGSHAQVGVLSLDPRGNLAESLGTSFASPIVAALLATVQGGASAPVSSLMAKTLLVHSAVLASPATTPDDLRYRGYGIPGDILDVLGCDPWRATLLFEAQIQAGSDLQRMQFPMPTCLRTPSGSFRGELTVTLAYEPPLDQKFGAEYCRSNIDVSFGAYDIGPDGKREQKRHVPPFPKPAPKDQFEETLIENGFKWSPIKVYRRVAPRGAKGDNWRLLVAATDRSIAEKTLVKVAIAMTIADIDRKAEVYNDVVVAMTQLGWSVHDVALRSAARERQ